MVTIDRIAKMRGILAAMLWRDGEATCIVNDERMPSAAIFAGVRRVMEAAGVTEVRVIIDQYTIVCCSFAGAVGAAMYPSAHPVIKSIRRSLRRVVMQPPRMTRRVPEVEEREVV